MKRPYIILSLFVALLMQYSCTKTPISDTGFKDQISFTIYDYLVANPNEYSSFLQILKAAELDKTLSAYNSISKKSIEYTLFVPDNKAVEKFIKDNGKYNSLDELLKDVVYVKALARYHVLIFGIISDDFPFGTFTEPNLTNDFLNVNFIVGADSTSYKINNQALVTKANIEASNGYIHVIDAVLTPITMNSYAWLKNNTGYSFFTSAIDACKLDTMINKDMKLKDQKLRPFTMLVEPDAIYKMRGINSFQDLADSISPGRTDYTQSNNPLNIFVKYHILTESKFLSDLEKNATNYNTFADVPININGTGLDIVINQFKEIFVSPDKKDTTDFVGLFYDNSNVNTQSGAIHFINQIMRPQVASRANVSFEFSDETALKPFRDDNSSFTYLFENHSLLKNVIWSGAELSYIKSIDAAEKAWSQDYFFIDGDFSITYNTPKVVQGKYNLFLQVGADILDQSKSYALVEVYVDGTKVGGLIDLTKGGTADNPYVKYNVGSVDFKNYAGHAIQVKTLIPGKFIWDVVIFEKI